MNLKSHTCSRNPVTYSYDLCQGGADNNSDLRTYKLVSALVVLPVEISNYEGQNDEQQTGDIYDCICYGTVSYLKVLAMA